MDVLGEDDEDVLGGHGEPAHDRAFKAHKILIGLADSLGQQVHIGDADFFIAGQQHMDIGIADVTFPDGLILRHGPVIKAVDEDLVAVDCVAAHCQGTQVGVNMEFQLLTDNLTALLWTPSADGVTSAVDWDIAFAGTNALTLGEFYNRHHSTAANNSTVKWNDELDALIETAKVAVTTEQQKEAYDAIQQYENADATVIPLFYIPSWVVTSNKLDTKGNAAGNDQFFYQKNILDWTIDRADNPMYTNTGAVNALEHPATNPALFWHQELVFDRLLNADTSLAPTDGLLAESYEVSEDGKTITFTIREGVVWHDGTPFTAEDVKWTFEYYPTVPGANTVMTDVINDAKAITVDGNKVIFEFNNPQPNALTVFSQWAIMPTHCLEKVAPENFAADTFWQAPIGTGPFKVETVKLGEYTTLVRNADYFITGTGNIEKIYMYPSTDAGDTNLITNAQAGNIDYAFCKDSAQVQQLQAMEGYNVETVNVTFPRYIFINMFERPAK